MQNQIIATNICKKIKDRKIVDNVSLDISQGEIIGLLGPNGAGKTTCFYMLLGLVPIDSGVVKISGEDVSFEPVHTRANLGIGYLAQEPSVFRKLSVEDNILAILETRKDLNEKQRQEKKDDLLTEFNLQHIRKSKGVSLSGGERRRVEIARVLATEPNFILLDEPFAGVDPISVTEIQKIVKYLADKGIGIIITDHNVRETLEICDKVYIMNNGRVICEGEPQHVVEHPKVRNVYLGTRFQINSSLSLS